jgi:hypothetical protein
MSVFHTWEHIQISVYFEIGEFYIWVTECLYKQLVGKDCSFICHDHKNILSVPVLQRKSGAWQSKKPDVSTIGLGEELQLYLFLLFVIMNSTVSVFVHLSDNLLRIAL